MLEEPIPIGSIWWLKNSMQTVTWQSLIR